MGLYNEYTESIKRFQPRLHGCSEVRHVTLCLTRFIWQHENRTPEVLTYLSWRDLFLFRAVDLGFPSIHQSAQIDLKSTFPYRARRYEPVATLLGSDRRV